MACRLRDYLEGDDRERTFAKITERECQLAFQNWAAYGRTSSPNVRAKEHLTCPLLWCRHRFESLASCLQHVSVCPWLPNAYYWCPVCQKAERFTPDDPGHELFPSATIDKKNSRLKRAVTFFKRFGRKPCSQAPIADQCTSSNQWHAKVHETSHHKPESSLDPDPLDVNGKAHAAADFGDFEFGFEPEERPHTLYDMEGNALSPLVGPDAGIDSRDLSELETGDPLFSSTQLGDTNVLPEYYENGLDERDQPSQRIPSHFGPFSLSMCFVEQQYQNSSASSAYEPPRLGELQIWERASWASVSKSDTKDPLRTSEFSMMYHDRAMGTEEVGNGRANAFELANSEVATAAGQGLTEAHSKFQSGQNRQKADQIGDLHDLVGCLHGHWLQEVRSTPGFPLVKSTICGLTPFEAGIRSLQQCFQGVSPSTFGGVLSLTHFAFSCAYAAQHDLNSPIWQDLFCDALEWSNNILPREDKALYIRIVCLLWAPQEDLHRIDQCATSECTKNSSVHLNHCQSSLEPEMEETKMDEGSQHVIPEVLSSTGVYSLTSGAVIKSCSRYLDGKQYILCVHSNELRLHLFVAVLEHARIVLRKDNELSGIATPVAPSSANIERVKSHILEPLLGWDGIGSFGQALMDTSDMLCRGLLNNIHDVEIMLTVTAKVKANNSRGEFG